MKTTWNYGVMVVSLVLAGCNSGGLQETLGLNREAPDEFTVVSRPPLSVPPEFSLRPPAPGEAPRGMVAEDRARSLLTGRSEDTAVTPVERSEGWSSGASSLLKRAGADQADDGIREKLGQDALRPADTSKATSLLEQLTGAEKNEPTVDAQKEMERLRANKDAGKPLNEGEVPEEKSKTRSLIDRIF